MSFKYKEGYTHAGRFHADEVFSTALMRILEPDFKVHRVYEVPEGIDEKKYIVYDIGRGRFDHHQTDAKVRKNGVPYAAFGLVWRAFSDLIFEDEKQRRKFDESFVQDIDRSDNTGEYHQLSMIIGNFNPQWNEERSADECFEDAVAFAKIILEREFTKRKAVGASREVVRKAYDESDGEVVFLEKFAPWKAWLMNTDAKFIIFPSDRGGYNVVAVPVSDTDNSPRVPFPAHWGGLENEELVESSGIKGLTFCHKGLFLVHTESEDAAFDAADEALDSWEYGED